MIKQNLKIKLEENKGKLDSLKQTHPKRFNFLLRLWNSKLPLFLITNIIYLQRLGIRKLYFVLLFNTLFLLLIYAFILMLIIFFTTGDVQIDISNIHYKNDTQIPVLIQVTGPNTGLSIELFKEYSNNLSRIAYIDYLEPQHTLNTSSNNSLVGNTLDIGKYSVFINTTNLTTGYYELKCVRPEFGGTYESFYLLESN